MSDLQLGVGLEGLDAVLSQLERINGAQQQVGQSSQAANRQAAAGATQATSAMQSFAQSGQNAAQRVQGVAGAVQQLVSAMGSTDRSAGMVASVAGATAQFAAMGSMLGPAGSVIGGIAGLVVGLQSVIAANNDVARTAREAQAALSALAQRRITDRGTAEFNAEISGGAISNRRSDADIELAAEERRISRERLDEEFRAAREARATVDEALSGSSTESAARQRADAERRYEARRDSLLTEYRALGDEVETLEGELSRRAAVAREAATAASAAAEASRTRRSGGGGGASERSAEELAWLDDVAVAQARAAEEEALRTAETEKRIAVEEREYALAMEIAAAAVEADERRKQQAEAARDAQREAMQAASEHRAELRSVAAEAESSFATGYVSSIDAVATAWRNANRAAREAGTGMLSSGRLLERGLVAVGNNIAESIGGTMVGALGSAVGAWLDGSKSIGEAAEGMAKSIIRGLVQEGIVQAVTETARGIADLASYQYATAGLHFAAAAAWGAVAGVAGAVGAATGAFGGGAGASQGPSQRELASRDRDEGQRGGTNIYNIYPGQVLATKDELSRVVLGAANYNARMGRRLDRRLSA